jgi:1,4-alpha-glucan branching enzyme
MGKSMDRRRAALNDPLDYGAIEALLTASHGAPFDVLGRHVTTLSGQRVTIVRAFIPSASAVSVVPQALPPDETPDKAIPMKRLRPEGLFSVTLPGTPFTDYLLEVQREGGATTRIADPYSFPPLIGDYDLHLIGEGNHHVLYEQFGAHPQRMREVDGVGFAVWAPNARRVSVVGDFNHWDDRTHPMRMRSNGVWELFIPGVTIGALYKYAVLSWSQGFRALKADPFAFTAELRPGTASRVWDLGGYEWGDDTWLRERERANAPDAPISVYELHAGSWKPDSGVDTPHVTYRTLAHQLAPYLNGLGYTHVELLPVAEHPFDGSWGYQVTGYFAPTSRYGSPQDFMYFVDYLHQHGIGVILDWVPAHFPKDAHGLAYFDGSHLYEHADPRQGEQLDWGTLVFNFGRNEVRNFLVSNALFWLDRYHIDGLRVDAVASMLYLDYSRKEGQWAPNQYGGRENLEAIAFLRECNSVVHARFPHALMIAEESTAWPGVTKPVDEGGLGFSYKWNMGWMHDILQYFHREAVHRTYHQNEMTFSFMYAFSERFMLPFSHDEVVHMKGSMINKMPGDHWQKFANLRALYGFMYGHPGKKLLFMGGEFAQWAEWNFAGFLDWGLLDEHNPLVERHRGLHAFVAHLNATLCDTPALHELDDHPDGFEWIDGSDALQSVVSFARWGREHGDLVIVVGNFTPVPRHNYRVGVPLAGRYVEVVNSDASAFGGSGIVNAGIRETEAIVAHGKEHSLSLSLPPLATILLRLTTDE